MKLQMMIGGRLTTRVGLFSRGTRALYIACRETEDDKRVKEQVLHISREAEKARRRLDMLNRKLKQVQESCEHQYENGQYDDEKLFRTCVCCAFEQGASDRELIDELFGPPGGRSDERSFLDQRKQD